MKHLRPPDVLSEPSCSGARSPVLARTPTGRVIKWLTRGPGAARTEAPDILVAMARVLGPPRTAVAKGDQTPHPSTGGAARLMRDVGLDAGALISLERGSPAGRGCVLLADLGLAALATGAAVVAQVWTGRPPGKHGSPLASALATELARRLYRGRVSLPLARPCTPLAPRGKAALRSH